MSDFFALSPSLSHRSLLEWWFNSNSIISDSTLKAACQVSSLLDTIDYSPTLTSGFEFHHYDNSKHPDYLVFLSSNNVSQLPSTILPLWWSRYIDILHSSVNNSSFELIPENWLEFDFVEPNLLLNGLWQRVYEPQRSFDFKVWKKLAESLSGSFISYESLVNNKLISLLVELFSLPQQIGLMHGRSQSLKLMFQLDSVFCLHNFNKLIALSSPDIRDIFSRGPSASVS